MLSLNKGKGNPGALCLTAISAADALKSDHGLQFMLLKHVLASVESTRGATNLSMCTDKSNVGGLSLQVSASCLDGSSCVACPQVLA